jgi:Flp pilus assembly protein TadG
MSLRMSENAFGGDARGIAAVEFALVLPLLLLMLFGSYDVSRMVMANQKVGVAAGTVAELVAAQPTGTPQPQANITAMVAAGTVAMAPFAASATTVTVSAIDLTTVKGTCCTATVNWSVTQGGTLRPCNTVFTQTTLDAAPSLTSVPAALASPPASVQALVPETAIIVTDVTFSYASIAPGLDKVLPATLHRTTYTYPRLAGQVEMTGPFVAVAGQTGKVC